MDFGDAGCDLLLLILRKGLSVVDRVGRHFFVCVAVVGSEKCLSVGNRYCVLNGVGDENCA